MVPEDLIAKWAPSGGAEGANAQPFVIDLCELASAEVVEIHAVLAVEGEVAIEV